MVFSRMWGRRNESDLSGVDAPPGYSHLEEIDHGGFSVVYRAHQDRFDRVVALKILTVPSLTEKEQSKFELECRTMGRLSHHPNIVTVYDAGVTPMRRPFLAMEYCSGGSLQRRIDNGGPLEIEEALWVGVKVATALHAAHQEGILHRDIKPQNLLMTSFGEPALADFGIAQMAQGDSQQTSTGFTLAHCAPEILEGRAASAASDIYAFGSTMYALLAGAPPYATEAQIGLAPLVNRIMRNDLPPLGRSDLPPTLLEVLYRTMSADPAYRYNSAAEIAEVLSRIEPPKSQPGPAVYYARGQATETGSHTVDRPAPAVPPVMSPLAQPRPGWLAEELARQQRPTVDPNGTGVHAAVLSGQPFYVPPQPPLDRRRLLIASGAGTAALLTIAGLTWLFWPNGGESSEAPGPSTTLADPRQQYRPANLSAQSAGGRATLIWTLPAAAQTAGNAVVVKRTPGSQPVTLGREATGLPSQYTMDLPSKDRYCFTVAVLLDPAKTSGQPLASSETRCVKGR